MTSRAFRRIPQLFAASAARVEGDIVYGVPRGERERRVYHSAALL